MKFTHEKLRCLIRRKLRFENRLAELLNMKHALLSLKLNNKIPFYERDIYNICRALDIPISDAGQYFFEVDDLQM